MSRDSKPTAAHPFSDGNPPHLPCGPGAICADVLLPGDPDRVDLFAAMLEDVKDFGRRREFAVVSGKYRGHPLTICSSGIGGPSTEIALIELAMLGAERVIRVGGMSSLVPHIPTGGLVCVDKAIGYSSVAKLYAGNDAIAAFPDPDLYRALRDARTGEDIAIQTGTVGSTDSYYFGQDRTERVRIETGSSEKTNFLSELKQCGAVGVDMECQTVLSVCQRLGLKAACLLGVHGNRATDDWLVNYEPTQRNLLKIAGKALAGSMRPH